MSDLRVSENDRGPENELAWFALQVRARYEQPIADLIQQKGFESYVPRVLCTHAARPGQRQSMSGTALFAGYVFCRMELQNRMPIMTTPGVNAIVGVGKRPEPINDEEIHSIRAAVASGLPVQHANTFSVGQLVRLSDGPLRGVQGRVLSIRDELWLIISISLLQRSIQVAVRPEWVAFS